MAKTGIKEINKTNNMTLAEYFANATKNKSYSDSMSVIKDNLNNSHFLGLIKNPEVEQVAKKNNIITTVPKVKILKDKNTAGVTYNSKLIGINLTYPWRHAIDLLSAIQHEITHTNTMAEIKGKINGEGSKYISRVKDPYYSSWHGLQWKKPDGASPRINIVDLLNDPDISNHIAKQYSFWGSKSPQDAINQAKEAGEYIFDDGETLAYGARQLAVGNNEIDKTTDQYRILQNMRKMYRDNLKDYFTKIGYLPINKKITYRVINK